MAAREFRHRLDDMLPSIDNILHAIAGTSFEDYKGNWLLEHAVERGIEIVSEGSRVVPSEIQALRPEIPWAKVRAIGNVLRHEYNGILDSIIWHVVVDERPRRRDAILAIKAQVGEQD